MTQTLQSLTTRHPSLTAAELIAQLTPPKHFADVSFASFSPNPLFPSQQTALVRVQEVAGMFAPAGAAKPKRSMFNRRRAPQVTCLYLDGGFGVGKTHLLAALALEVGPQRAAFGTFMEYTALVGALGFAAASAALGQFQLLCIDEFELDDPGDTLIMTRLIRELSEAGVSVVATSNTLPESLGEGRFASADFLREIQTLAARFEVLRIDGPDFRHRDAAERPLFLPDAEARASLANHHGEGAVVLDALPALLAHLQQVHPSRFGALVEGVSCLAITDFATVTDQNAALRLVVLVDRLYDNQTRVVLGLPRDTSEQTQHPEIFTAEMLAGGFRKKYFRALSRLTALTHM